MSGDVEGPPVQYDRQGRMRYHPAYHPRHKKPWTTTEQRYLIDNYANDGAVSVSLALGRTTGVVMTRAFELRQKGQMTPPVGRHRRTKRPLSAPSIDPRP